MKCVRFLFLVAAMPLTVPRFALADEFPDGASPLQSTELSQRLAGKVFTVQLKNGSGWRFEYKPNGYFFFNHSSGRTDSGDWKAEESKLCMKGRTLIDASCNEMRLQDGALLLKRDNGDVVQFVEKQ